MDVVVNLAGHLIEGDEDSGLVIRLNVMSLTDEIENFLWAWYDMVKKDLPIKYKKDVPIEYPAFKAKLIGVWPHPIISSNSGVAWYLKYDAAEWYYRPDPMSLTEAEMKFLGLDRDVEE